MEWTKPLWPVVAAAVMLAAACSSGDDAAPATDPPTTMPPATTEPGPLDFAAPEWQPETRAQELAWEMSTSPGGATLQHAIDAFGLLDPDFPGVTPSPMPAGEVRDGSSILALITSMRDQLTDEQQDALDAYLGAGTMVARVSPDGEVEVEAEVPASAASLGWRRPDSPSLAEYDELLAETRQAWIEHLPEAPGHYYELWFTDQATSILDAHVPKGRPDTCVISVHPEFTGPKPSEDTVRWMLAHELFHCMQFAWAANTSWNPHWWVAEGSAEWATADLYRNRPMDYNNLFEDWFVDGHRPLGARQYDAWPLYENSYQNGNDVYGSIIRMFREPQAGMWPMLVYGHLDGQLLRIDWVSRTLRAVTLTDDWWLDWVWRGSEGSGPTSNAVVVGPRGPGPGTFEAFGGFSQQLWINEWTSDVDVVTVSPVGSPFITNTANGLVVIADGSFGRFCFDPSGCVCPGEDSSGFHSMNNRLMIFAFAAVEKPPTAEVSAEEFDSEERCEDPEPQEPEYDEGSSNGDPHLVSFDGLPFDVLALGEFMLARDPAGGFEVQTRHEPIGAGVGTTAVAVAAGEHRVTFTMPDFSTTEPVVRVDGVETSATSFAAGEVTVARDGEGADLFWPDGSVVELEWYRGWFVRVTVPSERSARMEGLLGAADGDLRNDLQLADGTIIDTNEAAAPDSRYALAWAVDEHTTLFDYQPGQSPATFRVAHPSPVPPLLDLQLLERCSATLGVAAAEYEVTSCAYDVAATGDPGFVDQYADVVERRAEGVPEPPEAIVVRPTAVDVSVAPPVEGAEGSPVLTLGGDEEATIDAVAGAALLARTANCGDAHVSLVVAKADDRDALARAQLCDPSGLPAIGAGEDDEWINGEAYVWVPGDGAYDVAVDVVLGDRAAVGPVELYLDPTPTIVDVEALADGDTTTLRGVGDSAVYFVDPAATFTASGLDIACVGEVYWGPDGSFPSTEPRDLDVCGHRTEIDFPPADWLVPVVVVNRTAGDVVVELTPAA